MAVTDVGGILLSADEHIQALESVLAVDTILPLPTLTLARAVHEASITACYLVDPAVSPPMRFARSCALRLHTVQENQKTQALFGDVVDSRTAHYATEATSGLRRYLIDAGMDLRSGLNGQRVTSVSCAGARAPLILNMTELSLKYAPSASSSWVIGSGAAHSRPWLTQGIEGPRNMVFAAALLPLLEVADALADGLCGYVGRDSSALHAKTHLRRLSLYRDLGYTQPVASWSEYAAITEARFSPDRTSTEGVSIALAPGAVQKNTQA